LRKIKAGMGGEAWMKTTGLPFPQSVKARRTPSAVSMTSAGRDPCQKRGGMRVHGVIGHARQQAGADRV